MKYKYNKEDGDDEEATSNKSYSIKCKQMFLCNHEHETRTRIRRNRFNTYNNHNKKHFSNRTQLLAALVSAAISLLCCQSKYFVSGSLVAASESDVMASTPYANLDSEKLEYSNNIESIMEPTLNLNNHEAEKQYKGEITDEPRKQEPAINETTLSTEKQKYKHFENSISEVKDAKSPKIEFDRTEKLEASEEKFDDTDNTNASSDEILSVDLQETISTELDNVMDTNILNDLDETEQSYFGKNPEDGQLEHVVIKKVLDIQDPLGTTIYPILQNDQTSENDELITSTENTNLEINETSLDQINSDTNHEKILNNNLEDKVLNSEIILNNTLEEKIEEITPTTQIIDYALTESSERNNFLNETIVLNSQETLKNNETENFKIEVDVEETSLQNTTSEKTENGADSLQLISTTEISEHDKTSQVTSEVPEINSSLYEKFEKNERESKKLEENKNDDIELISSIEINEDDNLPQVESESTEINSNLNGTIQKTLEYKETRDFEIESNIEGLTNSESPEIYSDLNGTTQKTLEYKESRNFDVESNIEGLTKQETSPESEFKSKIEGFTDQETSPESEFKSKIEGLTNQETSKESEFKSNIEGLANQETSPENAGHSENDTDFNAKREMLLDNLLPIIRPDKEINLSRSNGNVTTEIITISEQSADTTENYESMFNSKESSPKETLEETIKVDKEINEEAKQELELFKTTTVKTETQKEFEIINATTNKNEIKIPEEVTPNPSSGNVLPIEINTNSDINLNNVESSQNEPLGKSNDHEENIQYSNEIKIPEEVTPNPSSENVLPIDINKNSEINLNNTESSQNEQLGKSNDHEQNIQKFEVYSTSEKMDLDKSEIFIPPDVNEYPELAENEENISQNTHYQITENSDLERQDIPSKKQSIPFDDTAATLFESYPPQDVGQTFNDNLADESSGIGKALRVSITDPSNRSTLIIILSSGTAFMFIIISVTIFLISFQRQHGTLDIEMHERYCGKDNLQEEDEQTFAKLLEVELPPSVVITFEEPDEFL